MIRGILSVLLAVTLLLALGEYLWGANEHAAFPWHRWPGLHALLGILASLAAVLVVKPLGKTLLQRPEDRDD